MKHAEHTGRETLADAFRYSFPVLLGYLAIGTAFGLLVADAGYPWWLALLMGVVMYAGAGQYIAIGLFAAGAGIGEAMLVQLAVNARHMAYGLTMFKRFRNAGPYRYYLIFALTDETFALLSSLPENAGRNDSRFMFFVALLDQLYWIAGSVTGALAGSVIPFDTRGVGFALTALFTVLMIEQMLAVRRPVIFAVSAAAAVLSVFLLPSRTALLGALAFSLAVIQLAGKPRCPA